MAAGLVCVLVSLVLAALARDLAAMLVAGFFYSLGLTLHVPAVLAYAMDSADPRRRGAAMASYTLWFQIGNSLGAATDGILADTLGYQAMYLVTAVAPLLGLLLVVRSWPYLNSARG